MTYKSAVAGLPLGGGKGVIVLPPDAPAADAPRPADVLLDFGDTVEALGGHYVTAEDVGTSAKDMEVDRRAHTTHVTGLSRRRGGSGDPSPYTALGVEAAIARDAASGRSARPSLRGRTRRASSGSATSALRLARAAARPGAKLLVADIDPAKREPRGRLGARWVTPAQRADRRRPTSSRRARWAACSTTSPSPRCRRRSSPGAANNQLADDARRRAARSERGILWAPDFVANAGGIINIAVELEPRRLRPGPRARARARASPTRCGAIYDDAERTGDDAAGGGDGARPAAAPRSGLSRLSKAQDSGFRCVVADMRTVLRCWPLPTPSACSLRCPAGRSDARRHRLPADRRRDRPADGDDPGPRGGDERGHAHLGRPRRRLSQAHRVLRLLASRASTRFARLATDALDQAAQADAARAAGDTRPAAGHPGPAQGQRRHQGHADHGGLGDAEGVAAHARRDDHAQAARRRRDHPRQGEPRRVRQLDLARQPQRVVVAGRTRQERLHEHADDDRRSLWLELGVGRRRFDGVRRGDDRHRDVRVDPRPDRRQRRRRDQDDDGPGQPLRHPAAVAELRRPRADHSQRHGRGVHPRSDRRPRPGRQRHRGLPAERLRPRAAPRRARGHAPGVLAERPRQPERREAAAVRRRDRAAAQARRDGHRGQCPDRAQRPARPSSGSSPTSSRPASTSTSPTGCPTLRTRTSTRSTPTPRRIPSCTRTGPRCSTPRTRRPARRRCTRRR